MHGGMQMPNSFTIKQLKHTFKGRGRFTASMNQISSFCQNKENKLAVTVTVHVEKLIMLDFSRPPTHSHSETYEKVSRGIALAPLWLLKYNQRRAVRASLPSPALSAQITAKETPAESHSAAVIAGMKVTLM